MCFGFILPFQSCKFKDWIFVYKSFTYYIIKNEDIYGKLKNDGSMIDYVYGPEPSKIWWRKLWTAPNREEPSATTATVTYNVIHCWLIQNQS